MLGTIFTSLPDTSITTSSVISKHTNPILLKSAPPESLKNPPEEGSQSVPTSQNNAATHQASKVPRPWHKTQPQKHLSTPPHKLASSHRHRNHRLRGRRYSTYASETRLSSRELAFQTPGPAYYHNSADLRRRFLANTSRTMQSHPQTQYHLPQHRVHIQNLSPGTK